MATQVVAELQLRECPEVSAVQIIALCMHCYPAIILYQGEVRHSVVMSDMRIVRAGWGAHRAAEADSGAHQCDAAGRRVPQRQAPGHAQGHRLHRFPLPQGQDLAAAHAPRPAHLPGNAPRAAAWRGHRDCLKAAGGLEAFQQWQFHLSHQSLLSRSSAIWGLMEACWCEAIRQVK